MRFLALLALTSSLFPLTAATVSLNLCNTGLNAGCAGVAPVNTNDPNWLVQAGSGGFNPAVIGDLSSAGLVGAYLANSSVSQWIGAGQLFDGLSSTTYTYQTTFQMPTGADLATVLITGRWRSDNQGLDILANGLTTSPATLPSSTSFHQSLGAWANFSISASNATFNAGTNTLEFRIRNAGGQHGGRIEFTSATVDVPVPEPGSWALMGGALMGLGLLRGRQARR